MVRGTEIGEMKSGRLASSVFYDAKSDTFWLERYNRQISVVDVDNLYRRGLLKYSDQRLVHVIANRVRNLSAARNASLKQIEALTEAENVDAKKNKKVRSSKMFIRFFLIIFTSILAVGGGIMVYLTFFAGTNGVVDSVAINPNPTAKSDVNVVSSIKMMDFKPGTSENSYLIAAVKSAFGENSDNIINGMWRLSTSSAESRGTVQNNAVLSTLSYFDVGNGISINCMLDTETDGSQQITVSMNSSDMAKAKINQLKKIPSKSGSSIPTSDLTLLEGLAKAMNIELVNPARQTVLDTINPVLIYRASVSGDISEGTVSFQISRDKDGYLRELQLIILKSPQTSTDSSRVTTMTE